MSRISSLAVRNVTHSFGASTVLDGVSFTVGPQQKVGIVGPNGVGKSTLLRIIAGISVPDSGTVNMTPSSATIGYLSQELERLPDETVESYLRRRTGVDVATRALDAASDLFSSGDPNAPDVYAEALDAFMALGAADFDTRIGEVLSEVSLTERVVSLPMAALSGGQAARVGLAVLLLSQFDIYLLDEPTNDLDFAGLDTLERFVNHTEAGMLIVSHDRAFLDRTITGVLELDASHQAREYNGNWASYLEARSVARRHAEQAYAENQSQRSNLTSRMQRQRQWTQAGVSSEKKTHRDNDKFVRNFRIEGTENQASKIAASERALERLEKVDKPWEGWELHLEFKAGPRSGDIVARLDEAIIKRGDFQLGPIDLEVYWADRIAITGANGSGKTTLLNALLGRIPLVAGTQHLGPGVILGEIDQARGVLHSNDALVSVFSEEAGVLIQEARSLLAKFDLTATHVERPANSLSPGERTRATLALLMARGTNCVVLDEPTNHLDLEAIEQLEIAIGQFDGTVLLVTHDRSFLERVNITRTVEL